MVTAGPQLIPGSRSFLTTSERGCSSASARSDLPLTLPANVRSTNAKKDHQLDPVALIQVSASSA